MVLTEWTDLEENNLWCHLDQSSWDKRWGISLLLFHSIDLLNKNHSEVIHWPWRSMRWNLIPMETNKQLRISTDRSKDSIRISDSKLWNDSCCDLNETRTRWYFTERDQTTDRRTIDSDRGLFGRRGSIAIHWSNLDRCSRWYLSSRFVLLNNCRDKERRERLE